MTKMRFLKDECGAAMVEYAVALIVVTLVGGVLFLFGADMASVIDASAGAF